MILYVTILKIFGCNFGDRPRLSEEVIEKIPNEVLAFTFELIISSKDLKSPCLVNKRFNVFARRLLWRRAEKATLTLFTVEDFKWVSKMPIQTLDISELVVSKDKRDGTEWIGHCDSLNNEFDLSSMIDLFKRNNEMEHLHHLKVHLT